MAEIVQIDGSEPEPPTPQTDAHGQAALMLAESILHALVEAGMLTTDGALAIVQTAQEVKEEIGKESREATSTIETSLHLLGRIATSFESDLN